MCWHRGRWECKKCKKKKHRVSKYSRRALEISGSRSLKIWNTHCHQKLKKKKSEARRDNASTRQYERFCRNAGKNFSISFSFPNFRLDATQKKMGGKKFADNNTWESLPSRERKNRKRVAANSLSWCRRVEKTSRLPRARRALSGIFFPPNEFPHDIVSSPFRSTNFLDTDGYRRIAN